MLAPIRLKFTLISCLRNPERVHPRLEGFRDPSIFFPFPKIISWSTTTSGVPAIRRVRGQDGTLLPLCCSEHYCRHATGQKLADGRKGGFYMESLFQVVIVPAKDWGPYYYGRREEHILGDN